MSDSDIITVILAAGEGTRMKSSKPKVMFSALNKPLLGWVKDAVFEAVNGEIIAVVGKGVDEVKAYFKDDIKYAHQSERLGSGHAVMCASPLFEGKGGYILILAGDSPLITPKTIKELIDKTRNENYDACLLSAAFEDATGYGRIVKDKNGLVEKIVEHKDATEEQLKIKEINASVYCVKEELLSQCLKQIRPVNAQGEYYLTDIVELLYKQGKKVASMQVKDTAECMGVNTRVQLAQVSEVLRMRVLEKLMLNGVTIIDPKNTYIDADVKIGTDSIIYPNVTLEGNTVIGEGTILYPGSRIADSKIGSNTKIQNSVILESLVGDNTIVGPFAYLRPESNIGNNCRVGDFVEVKNAYIADGAKVSHLTYVGDGEIGEKTNVGCGVVFVNYDGSKKCRTHVGKNCFIGCNVNLIAPVSIGDGSYIAAGSTVTSDVPGNSLCIARSRQTIKQDWDGIVKKEK